ncbi:hypothetical protein EUTSA_v10014988mg [Eutrema salsugineum]|uniref:Transmembrane protein n=1 Tax=Eutrema salsugineum TaxID=72664 RepID=V4LJR9_EUTSA|nr:hypothetical protein EUTSA_v10014988mg [Eutrema salsugineum]
MGGDGEERYVWKLRVGVRVRRFSLKLHLHKYNLLSSWKLHRLSFLLRFRKHHLKILSQSKPHKFCVPLFHKPIFGFGFFRRRKRAVVHSPQLVDLIRHKTKLIWNRSLVFSNKSILFFLFLCLLFALVVVVVNCC